MLLSPAEKKHISWSLPDSRSLISQNMSKWLGMFTRHVLISKSCLPMASDILELQLLLFKLLPYICQGLSQSAHLESRSESDLTHLISDLSWPCTWEISRPSLAFVVFCGKTHLHARHLLLHVIACYLISFDVVRGVKPAMAWGNGQAQTEKSGCSWFEKPKENYTNTFRSEPASEYESMNGRNQRIRKAK